MSSPRCDVAGSRSSREPSGTWSRMKAHLTTGEFSQLSISGGRTMRVSLIRSTAIRSSIRCSVAIACFTSLVIGCGGEPESSSQAAPNDASPSPAVRPEERDVAAADWPAYNRTLAGDRFSPLAEIHRRNVAQLRIACTYTLPEVSAMQAGPIVVDGTMYFTTESNSYSIDA